MLGNPALDVCAAGSRVVRQTPSHLFPKLEMGKACHCPGLVQSTSDSLNDAIIGKTKDRSKGEKQK